MRTKTTTKSSNTSLFTSQRRLRHPSTRVARRTLTTHTIRTTELNYKKINFSLIEENAAHEIRRLQEENERLLKAVTAAKAVTTTSNDNRRLKFPEPPRYNGTKGTLRGYLTQMRAYIVYYGSDLPEEADKVMCAAAFLTGDALIWFEPFQRDYLEKGPNDCDPDTKDIFSSYATYEKKLKAAFGDPDEERTAEQQLHNLRQKGSASDCAAKFQQISLRLNWEDGPKMVAFYHGLRDEIKDELAKQDRPKQFMDYVAMAVRIDNRLFERRMEKRTGPVRPHRANMGKRVPPRQGNTSWRTHRGPMELDATQHQSTKKGIRCFNCGKLGHYSRECTKPRSRRRRLWLRLIEPPVTESRRARPGINRQSKDPAPRIRNPSSKRLHWRDETSTRP